MTAEPGGIRVLVVDDHEVVQWGLRLLLTQQPWVERCLTALTLTDALALAGRWEPRVALVDLFIDQEFGADLVAELRSVSPSTRVLLFSGASRLSPERTRSIGAAGFVSKQRPGMEIVEAVRVIARGRRIETPVKDLPLPHLSGHERELLELIASGATNREIGDRLALSPHTIKEHASALYRKLRARNRPEAVQRALQLGMIG